MCQVPRVFELVRATRGEVGLVPPTFAKLALALSPLRLTLLVRLREMARTKPQELKNGTQWPQWAQAELFRLAILKHACPSGSGCPLQSADADGVHGSAPYHSAPGIRSRPRPRPETRQSGQSRDEERRL